MQAAYEYPHLFFHINKLKNNNSELLRLIEIGQGVRGEARPLLQLSRASKKLPFKKQESSRIWNDSCFTDLPNHLYTPRLERKDQTGESVPPHEAELLSPAGVEKLPGSLVGFNILIRIYIQQIIGANRQVDGFGQLISDTQVRNHFAGEYLLVGDRIGRFGNFPKVDIAQEYVKFPGAQVEGQVDFGSWNRLFQIYAAGLIEVDIFQPFQFR